MHPDELYRFTKERMKDVQTEVKASKLTVWPRLTFRREAQVTERCIPNPLCCPVGA